MDNGAGRPLSKRHAAQPLRQGHRALREPPRATHAGRWSPSPKAPFFPYLPTWCWCRWRWPAGKGEALRAGLHHRLGARRHVGLCHRRLPLRHGRPLADLGLWLWRGDRRLPRGLRQMGRLDHPDQGHDAHPLQDRHHRLGLRRLQLLHVRAAVDYHPGRCASSSRPSCCACMASRSAISSRSG